MLNYFASYVFLVFKVAKHFLCYPISLLLLDLDSQQIYTTFFRFVARFLWSTTCVHNCQFFFKSSGCFCCWRNIYYRVC